MKILVVDDEKSIALDIQSGLTEAGFIVETCHDGQSALTRGFSENFAAVVLDLGLPQLDGLTVLKRWRAENMGTPVIILTARSGWIERVGGMNAGADDYLSKPFKMEELIARLRAILRRATGNAAPLLSAGPLSLDTAQMQVMLDGRNIRLTPLELRFLSYLMHHKGRVISRDELREQVYGETESRDLNAIEAIITRIRRKVGDDVIETRRGQGYIVSASA